MSTAEEEQAEALFEEWLEDYNRRMGYEAEDDE